MEKNKFIYEIGVEEIPAQYAQSMADSFKIQLAKKLDENLIEHSEVKVFHAPRRFVAIIDEMNCQTSVVKEEVKGPAKANAFCNDEPSKALLGFLKGKGKQLSDIFYKELNGVEYVYVNVENQSQNSVDLLPKICKETLETIFLPNAMRWADFGFKFVRPIRWLVAYFGNTLIDFENECCKSGDFSKGNRALCDEKITINNANEFEKKLEQSFVIFDENRRQKLILEQIANIEKQHNVKVMIEDELLDEIVNLVEYPTCELGEFPKEFLELPAPVIITPMKDHQRYFPVFNNGVLTNNFVFVRNGNNEYIDIVRKGNQRVLVARLKDGEFFFKEDLQSTLQSKAQQLDKVLFQEKLGSMAEKQKRVQKIAEYLNDKLNLDYKLKIQTICQILKADLVSKVVGEFSELQGVMGGIYAKFDNYDDEICKAVGEQYMPTSSKGELPTTELSGLIAIADKLDSIMGLDSVGLGAKGSQDPYGLRRMTLGILAIQEKFNFNLDLANILCDLSNLYEDFLKERGLSNEQYCNTLIDFVAQRMKGVLIDEKNIDYAILDEIPFDELNIFEIISKATLLVEIQNREWFANVKQAFLRVSKILKNKTISQEVNTNYFVCDDEKKLFSAYEKANSVQNIELKTSKKYSQYLQNLQEIANCINVFFDNNLVLCDDKTVCQNRINMLAKILMLYKDVLNI